MNGGWDTGTWDDATWDYVSQIVEFDTHDGDYLKKKFAKEVADAARRKAEIVYAFERIVEGRPEAAAEIAEPFTETRAATLPEVCVCLKKEIVRMSKNTVSRCLIIKS